MASVWIVVLSLCCYHPYDAVAVITPRSGSDVRGIVYFIQEKNGVKVRGSIIGLVPHTIHGFHIHEYGDISGKGGEALGGHFNPDRKPHGLPHHKRHLGDLGNIRSNGKGVAEISTFREGLCLTSDDYSVLGRGVVIHEKKDDGSQPSGNAGKRIGVGVIGVSQETH